MKRGRRDERTVSFHHDPSTSRNGRLNPRRRADAPFHQKLQGNKSKIAAAAADSPPLPLFPLLRPIRLSLTAEERNGRLSVGAHCVQITTNHLFLWIVPRSAGSIVPPLVNSSFRFRASIIKDRGGSASDRPPFDYSTCSLRFIAGQPCVCPLRFVFRAANPFPRSVAEDNDDVIGSGEIRIR